MKIGFIEPATNPKTVFEEAVEAAKQFSGIELVKKTAPEVLKIPAAAKKMLSEQEVDCVIAYIVSSEEESHALALLQEKIIDVEVYSGKYVFIAVSEMNHASDAIKHALTQAAEFVGNIDTGLKFQQQSEEEVKDLLGENESHNLF